MMLSQGTRGRTMHCSLRLLGGLLVAAMAAGLSGCRDEWRLDNDTGVRLNQMEARHPITFDERREILHLELPHMGASLSPSQEADVAEFLQRYRRQGAGGLRLSTPTSARAEMAAARSVAAIETLAGRAGIDAANVRRGRHRRDATYGDTIQLAFKRPVAVAPRCGNWPDDLGVDRERVPYENFGCATQHNFAKMVANSRDLVQPQPETPRAAERRSVHWSEYIGGGGGTSVPAGVSPEAKPGGAKPTR